MKSNNTNYDILIIEDDDATIIVLKAFFKIKGYSCLSASNGTKGLNLLNTFFPKIILLDILLPDIKGYGICKQIKSNEKLRDIPVFYISALPEYDTKEIFEETQANGYFLKPFNFSEFEILFTYLQNH